MMALGTGGLLLVLPVMEGHLALLAARQLYGLGALTGKGYT
jgi:hypothetical protein